MFSRLSNLNFYLLLIILLSLTTTTTRVSGTGVFDVNDSKSNQYSVIRGGGSTLAQRVWDAWRQSYLVLRDTKIDYEAVGSDLGIQRVLNGEYFYGGTDLPLTEQQHQKYPELMPIPIVATSIVVGYNLAGVSSLSLSRDTLVKIFSGNITQWNDHQIVRDNPDTLLPNSTINVIVRSDGSGTTFAFSGGLNRFDPSFPGPFVDSKWDARFKRTSGSLGVAIEISRTPNSLGYVGVTEANLLRIKGAKIENKEGKYIAPSVLGVSSAISNSESKIEDIRRPYRDILDSPGVDTYPISSYSYAIVHENAVNITCDKLEEIFRFVLWITTTSEANEITQMQNFVSLGSGDKQKAFEILKLMKCNGESVFERVVNPLSLLFSSGKVVIFISCFLMSVTLGLGVFIYVTRNYPAIKCFSPSYASLILLGAFFGFLSLIFWSLKVSESVCILRLWFTSIGYPLILGNLLAKNYRLYQIFRRDLKNMLTTQIPDAQIAAFSLVSVAIHILILIVWTAVDPPTINQDFTVNGNYNFCKCKNPENEMIFSYILIGYNTILLILSCILSFLIRKLPLSYNESRHIAYVAYNFIFALLLVPIYLSVIAPQTSEEGSNAVLYCIIIYTNLFPVIVLFVPKIYLVYIYGDSPEAIKFSFISSSNTNRDYEMKKSQAKSHQAGNNSTIIEQNETFEQVVRP